jgi:mRNA interferase MazF
MARAPRRFDIWLVSLNPVRGSEIAKTRPCVIVSPDELNAHLTTVLAAPLTSTRRGWPHRVALNFAGVDGEIATDQLRSLDHTRLIRPLGHLDEITAEILCARLVAMFSR